MGLKQALVTTIDDYKADGRNTQEIGEAITAAHLAGQIDKEHYMFAINYLLTGNV